MALLLIIPKKFKIFANPKIYLGFKKFSLEDLKLSFLLCIKPNGKKKISKKLVGKKIGRIQPYYGVNQNYFAVSYFTSPDIYFSQNYINIASI